MLPSDLLIYRQNGETVVPKKLTIDDRIIAEASDRIDCFQEYKGKTQRELDEKLTRNGGRQSRLSS